MAFSEFELKKNEKAINAFLEKNRPPPHVRKELDIGYRVKDQSIEIVEIRPRWDNPSEIIEHPCAKATYVKKQKIWKIYWQRADLKWHKYDPHPEVATLEDFLKIVETDSHSCFFG